jgi:hypothetical protein
VTWVGVAGFEPAASSSRSQVAKRIVSAAARLTCGRQSIGVCQCPSLAPGAVTYFVTRSAALAGDLDCQAAKASGR